MFFFHWKAIYKSVYKGLHKSTENHWDSRSSRTKVFCKKGAFRNFAKFTEKHLRQSLFLNKVAVLNVNQYGISTEIPYFLGWISSFSVMPEVSPLSVFFRDKVIFVFSAEWWYRTRNIYIYIYRKYHISMYFSIKITFHFPSKYKLIFSGKRKYHLFRYYKKYLVQVRVFWKDHLLRRIEENIFPRIFLRKIIFPFVSKK